MLSSISWQHYLSTVFILSASYYLYVILRYYQSEIPGLFRTQTKQSAVFPSVQSASFEVMGEVKPDNGVTFSDSENLQFTDPTPEAMEEHSIQPVNQEVPLTETASGLSQELVVEAGNLIDAFKEIDNKQEFINLFKILVDSYKKFNDDIDLPFALSKVMELAKEKLKFPIVLTDLQNN
jgi:hypothetical protein